ncbi:MAG: cytochrome c oxidase subunit II [Bdellovibrionales bacterium]
MPYAATEIAKSYDSLYIFLLVASFISCVLVIGGLIVFAIQYRRKKEGEKTAYISHNAVLEFLWSFIPFVIFMVVFVWGWIVFHKFRSMPENALEVAVNAQKWDWSFTFKNGRTSAASLTVPVNRDVKLVMSSKDVLHSFYVPAFRNKQDVVPGRYTTLWFNAQKEGTYNVFCAEYCGDSHSGMLAKINVVSPEKFDEWLRTEPYKGMSPVQIGEKVYGGRCKQCHTLDGTKLVGPTFKNVFGRDEKLADGASLKVDENYIRESIVDPNLKIVEGYPPGVMPTFAGQLSDEEIMGVIEYLKTVQ